MSSTITKIVGRGILLVGFFVLVVSALYARGVEPEITFATYGIDLKIDSKATYNGVYVPSGSWHLKNLVPGVDKFWNFKDIKPGDQGENTISLHVKNSDAWLCLDFDNLKGRENGINEPESHVDSNNNNSGELTKNMEFFAWHDDGDNKFEKWEKSIFGTSVQSAYDVLNDKTYTIGDYSNGKVCKKNQTCYIGIWWCAGNLSVDTVNAMITCDGNNLGNIVQTDSMSVDVSLRAVPAKENPKFYCKNNDSHNPPHYSYNYSHKY